MGCLRQGPRSEQVKCGEADAQTKRNARIQIPRQAKAARNERNHGQKGESQGKDPRTPSVESEGGRGQTQHRDEEGPATEVPNGRATGLPSVPQGALPGAQRARIARFQAPVRRGRLQVLVLDGARARWVTLGQGGGRKPRGKPILKIPR
jgi:hypothetical protein